MYEECGRSSGCRSNGLSLIRDCGIDSEWGWRQ